MHSPEYSCVSKYFAHSVWVAWPQDEAVWPTGIYAACEMMCPITVPCSDLTLPHHFPTILGTELTNALIIVMTHILLIP